MTYIKTLIILTGLALLTACAGGVAINSTVINNGSDDLCEANPFATGCTTPTPEQEATFCGDDGKPTDTKTDDCAPTVERVCNANVFDTLCPKDPTPTEAKDFCGDDTKTTDTKTNDCAPVVMRVCTNGDIFDDFCTGLPDTDTMRANACQTHGTDAGGDDSCAASLASSCTITDPFIYAGCKDVEGIAGVRTMYCQTLATAWDAECMDTAHGAVSVTRLIACQMFGTNTDTGGHATCAPSLTSFCTIADPFAYTGCKDVEGIAEVRMMYCQAPATAWDEECMDITHGTVDATRVTACEMFGTDTDTGGHATCATSLTTACDIRDPFAYTGCNNVEGIARVRMMYCETPANAWDAECMDGMHGTVDATRVTACQMFGTGTGGDNSCATSLAPSCTITDPFAYTGCNNVEGIAEVRMMYCQAPATAWDEECMDTAHGTVSVTRVMACQMFGTNTDTGGHATCATSLTTACDIRDPFAYTGCNNVVGIAGVRVMYCQAPATAWDGECMETTHGTVNATRVTACQMFGTGTGGDNSCAASLASSCTITDPFAYTGCNNVAGIAEVRVMYCETPATAWDAECMDGMHGDVTIKRGDACLKFGTDTNAGGHVSCVGNTLAESSCASNPFDDLKPGCAILTKFEMIVRTYCMNNHLAGCPTATHAAWVASFPENAPLRASNLAPAAGNKFVAGLEAGLNRSGFTPGTLVEDSFNFQSARYNGIGFGGNATEGVAFQYGVIDGTRYFYAGLLSGTNLGPPLTAVTTDATWYGQIVILQRKPWYLTPEGKIYGDIDLTVNYDGNNNGTIRGSYNNEYNEYTVNGTFDSKGIMGGNVTRSKIHTYRRMTFVGDTTATELTTYSFTRRIVGPLTGLVGQTEAVGVFIGQDFTDYDDRPRQLDARQNNFEHRAMGAGFAGGFIARSTRPQ